MDLFDLFAKITLDTSEYESGLEKSEDQGESFAQKLKGGLGTAAKVGGIALGALATGAVAMGTSFLKSAGNVASYGDKIDKASQMMGISAQAYQEWDAILQHSGTSIDGLKRGMMTLSSAANKNSKAFQKLGISEDKVASMNQEELFSAVITGLQGMEEGTERAALAQELLGGAAKELGPLLNTSAEETEAMRQRVHELGGVMSDDAVKASAAYQDSLQDMQTSITGLKNNIISTFLPGITTVMNGLTKIFSGDSEGGVAMITGGIKSIVDNITENMPTIVETGSQIVTGLLSAITANLPQLIQSGAELLLNLIVGILQQLPTLIAMAPQIIKNLVSALVKAAPALGKAGLQIIEAIVKGISLLYNKILDVGKNVITNIQSGISTAFEGLQSWISEKFSGLIDKITTPFEKAKEAVKKVIDSMKKLFNFNFTMPKIKLPHIKWGTKTFTILGKAIEVPDLTIEWYKKAYNTPYMFTNPTVMGGLGFGDGQGGEMVYGHDNLMRDISAAARDDERMDIIIDLLRDIVENGVNANFNRNQMYKTMASMNRSRSYATGYNGFSGV